ncbi:MAG TPA: diguanylate cyclase, partial [Candidatus Dormibacteraeota bacterium]|nr:diguanylate cyclase [Candidatus Dormibacteraeota bacterium]
MSILGLLCLLFALIAALVLVLYGLKRRELSSFAHLAQELQRIAIGGRLPGRVDLESDNPDITATVTAVNHLLTRAARGAEREATQAPKLFAELGDRIHEAVLVHREVIVYANRQFASLVGVDRVELVGRRLADLVPPEYSELVSENIRRRLAGEPAAERYEIDMVGLQGQVSRLEIASTPVAYDHGQALLITGVEIIPTQTTPALRLNQEPSSEPQLLALQSLAEAIITTDKDGRILALNPTAELLTGSTAPEAIGKLLEDIVSLVDETDRRLLSDPVHQALTSGAPVNLSRRALLLSRTNGSEHSIELSASPIRNAAQELIGAVVLLHDVTEMRGLARQMSYQATHDALTGLVNRREFERRLEEAIESGHRGDGQHVLCYLDLDRFKLVNDTSGHLAGDSMLREVAKLLRDAVRDSDTVARLGGDEFGTLLVGCPLDKARQIADDLTRSVGDYRFVWKDKIFNIGVSVGLVEISRESGTLEELLAAADTACYVAKKQGSGRVAVYSARDEALARHTGEIQWLQRLQTALKENRFQLYHQVIVPAHGEDGGPAMEVLLRLRDEAGHELPPSEFMRAAERYRLMGLVDRWVVQATFAALGRGALPIPANRSVAINVSGQTLGDAQFLEYVVECFDSTGVSPAQVCFEISESAVVANLDHARRFVGVLHGMGCQFALDDFGS